MLLIFPDMTFENLGRFMFDLILFFLTFLDQQVFAIIISYRLGGLFGIFGRHNDSRELGGCKACRRHA